jgi:tetratricopeptide (TPR) repeat protein
VTCGGPSAQEVSSLKRTARFALGEARCPNSRATTEIRCVAASCLACRAHAQDARYRSARLCALFARAWWWHWPSVAFWRSGPIVVAPLTGRPRPFLFQCRAARSILRRVRNVNCPSRSRPSCSTPSCSGSASNRKALAAVILGLAASVLQTPALALVPDSSAEVDAESDVDAIIARGIALRREGDDARALDVFRQAEKLEPDSARVQVHLAATYQALGQWEAADRYLTKALGDPSDPYIQKHQATLAAARHTVDGHISTLEIGGSPRGAQIRLNGRLLGTLPLTRPVRVEAGIYTLEAQLPGYYPMTRSVALAGGVVVQEAVELAPQDGDRGALTPTDGGNAPGPRTSWVTWTLAGLAVGAGVGTGAAYLVREAHADTWNDDRRCLRPGQTRDQVCGAELTNGERAETWMWIGTAATGAFAAGAVVSYLLLGVPNREDTSTALSCGVGVGELSCAGTF